MDTIHYIRFDQIGNLWRNDHVSRNEEAARHLGDSGDWICHSLQIWDLLRTRTIFAYECNFFAYRIHSHRSTILTRDQKQTL